MKATTRNKLDHSMSIIVSMVVNGLLFMALLTYIQMSGEPDKDLSKTIVIEQTEQEIIDEVKQEVVEEVRDPEEVNEQLDYSMDEVAPTDITTESEAVDTATPTDVNEMTQLLSDIASPVVMSGLMVGRTELGRKAALGKYGAGGGGRSEAAVIKSLQWLRDRQLPSGAWNQSGNIADTRSPSAGMTGLALLAFLAHGETPSSAEYGSTVARAIRFLVDNQDARGLFQPAGGHTVYGHAIATYAIAEAYTMTENSLLKEPMERGVKVILDGQQANGGYEYDYTVATTRNDSSVAAWQLQALKAAKIAGATNPNLEALLQRGMDGMLLNSRVRQDGTRSFGYTKADDSRKIISAAGALCLQLTGRGESKDTKLTLDFIAPHVPNWANGEIKEGGGSIYFWYYAAQARFHADPEGKLFKDFNGPMVTEFSQNQNPDGSWTDPTEAKHGPVMSTALGALTLMVYYRHLPTTQHDRIRPAAVQEAVKSLDEDVIKFAL